MTVVIRTRWRIRAIFASSMFIRIRKIRHFGINRLTSGTIRVGYSHSSIHFSNRPLRHPSGNRRLSNSCFWHGNAIVQHNDRNVFLGFFPGIFSLLAFARHLQAMESIVRFHRLRGGSGGQKTERVEIHPKMHSAWRYSKASRTVYLCSKKCVFVRLKIEVFATYSQNSFLVVYEWPQGFLEGDFPPENNQPALKLETKIFRRAQI